MGSSVLSRVWATSRAEVVHVHPRLLACQALASVLPHLAFQRLRSALYRLAGIRMGQRTLLAGPLQLIGPGRITSRLVIGDDCWLNSPFFADLTGDITIGNGVTIGHHAVLVTSNHDLGPSERRAGKVMPASIVIQDGVWLGACVTLLPGARIGKGAVIGAGSMVLGEIPAGMVAVGSPARVIRPVERTGVLGAPGPGHLALPSTVGAPLQDGPGQEGSRLGTAAPATRSGSWIPPTGTG